MEGSKIRSTRPVPGSLDLQLIREDEEGPLRPSIRIVNKT